MYHCTRIRILFPRDLRLPDWSTHRWPAGAGPGGRRRLFLAPAMALNAEQVRPSCRSCSLARRLCLIDRSRVQWAIHQVPMQVDRLSNDTVGPSACVPSSGAHCHSHSCRRPGMAPHVMDGSIDGKSEPRGPSLQELPSWQASSLSLRSSVCGRLMLRDEPHYSEGIPMSLKCRKPNQARRSHAARRSRLQSPAQILQRKPRLSHGRLHNILEYLNKMHAARSPAIDLRSRMGRLPQRDLRSRSSRQLQRSCHLRRETR